MKIAVLSIPAIVGHNPRTTSGLRDALGVTPNDWYLADPYAGVAKSWWYPASVALPLPGINHRREAFVATIQKQVALEAIAEQATSLRQRGGYDKVIAVGWSLGAWFALSKLEHFDGAVLISPMLEAGQLQKVGYMKAPDKPILMVVGGADTDVPNVMQVCQRWDERQHTEIFIIDGAAHPFDQLRLKEGGKLKNPLYKLRHEQIANLAIAAFVRKHF